MNLDEKILKRFEEVIADGHVVRTTITEDELGNFEADFHAAEKWGVSSLSLIGRALGRNSDHFERFLALYPEICSGGPMLKALGVLEAAHSDYKGGYLFDARNAIRAEVFDEFIDQADYFLGEGYFQVAAVIAGSVLEDSMRQLCARRGLTLPTKPKLDTMNTELAKAGVYDKLVHKRITMLAGIRNKAAHGDWKAFKEEDSAEMVKAVRRSVEDYS